MNLFNEFITEKDLHNEYVKWLFVYISKKDAYEYIKDNIKLNYLVFYDRLDTTDFFDLIKYSKEITKNILNSGVAMPVCVYEYIVDIYPDITTEFVSIFVYELSLSNNRKIYLSKILDYLPNNKFSIDILENIDMYDVEIVYFINSNIEYPNDVYQNTIENLYTSICNESKIDIQEWQLYDIFFIKWFIFLNIDVSEFVIKYNLYHLIDANKYNIYLINYNTPITLKDEASIINYLISKKLDDKLIEIINKGSNNYILNIVKYC